MPSLGFGKGFSQVAGIFPLQQLRKRLSLVGQGEGNESQKGAAIVVGWWLDAKSQGSKIEGSKFQLHFG